MTTEQITAIMTLARRMPQYRQYATRRLGGAELLEMGYTEWEGGAIDPTRTYAVCVACATNHVRMLLRVYQEKGRDALRDRLAGASEQLLQNALGQ